MPFLAVPLLFLIAFPCGPCIRIGGRSSAGGRLGLREYTAVRPAVRRIGGASDPLWCGLCARVE